MSVRLDEMFDESPGVVCLVLSQAIEAAGWRLVHVSEAGDTLVWQVVDVSCEPATLRAVIEPYGAGAHVRVTSYGEPGVTTGLEGVAERPEPTHAGDNVLHFRRRKVRPRHE